MHTSNNTYFFQMVFFVLHFELSKQNLHIKVVFLWHWLVQKKNLHFY